MKENKSSFYKGAVCLTLSAIILKVIGLVYKVPLSYILGDEGMGYFNSAYTVYTFFYVLGSAGIPKAISIAVARAEAESKGTSHQIYKVCFVFFFVFGMILSILFFALSGAMSRFIGSSGSLFSMYSIAPSILFVCASGVARGYLSGNLRFVPIAISELIAGVVKLLLGLGLAYFAIGRSYSLPIISAYTIFGITIGSFFSLIYLLVSAGRGKNLITKSSGIDFLSTLKDILRIALPITLASSVSGIASMLDLGLIMKGLVKSEYSSSVSAALYGNYTTLALPMFTLVTTLITPISSALMPNLTHSLAVGNVELGEEKIKSSLSFIYFISVPCAFMYFLFPVEILSLIFEEGSARLGAALLAALAPSVLIIGPLTVINTALESSGRVTLPVLSLTVGSLFKLVSCTLLISIESVGILAAPLSTLISYAVSFAMSYLFFKRSGFGRVSVLHGLPVPLLISILISALGTALYPMLSHNLGQKASCTILLMILGALYLIFSLILSKDARITISNFVKLHKNDINHL